MDSQENTKISQNQFTFTKSPKDWKIERCSSIDSLRPRRPRNNMNTRFAKPLSSLIVSAASSLTGTKRTRRQCAMLPHGSSGTQHLTPVQK